MSKVTPARMIACDAFVEVMEKKRKPDDVLEEFYEKNSAELKRIDKNLTKEILFGGLRWYKKIFWILQQTSTRDLTKLSPQVRAALVLGTYQIFYMDRVPERAAVNEAAEYMKAKKELGAVGFVNGILRQIARRAEYFAKPDKKKQAVEYLALQFSHPDWLVHRWLPRFGFEKMEVMLMANNQPPPIHIRINSLRTPIENVRDVQDNLLREEHIHSERISAKSGLLLKKHPDVGQESQFGSGLFTFQDQASQLIPLLMDIKEGDVILDAAAGPGGKFSHIYELGKGNITLIGVEKDALQMQRAKETMNRLHPQNKAIWHELDFAELKLEQKVDKILLDAPCTGLGVLRRHPEGKWHKDSSGISTLAATQRKLITHALTLLRSGGELTYSVCSFEPEETEDHLHWLKSEFKDKIEIISPVSRLPDYFKRYVTRDNILMIYAGNQDDMDGFGAFCVKWKG
ncbi:MAG: 16S rRNA (cytosine(967)-C(5))-methyltransferase RsmB [Proteobacteria bacterium]|nr:16S rRNA (cytosine(967)-C(5))-methyltransferase RsmB [Pseudomonadota bacterium]